MNTVVLLFAGNIKNTILKANSQHQREDTKRRVVSTVADTVCGESEGKCVKFSSYMIFICRDTATTNNYTPFTLLMCGLT